MPEPLAFLNGRFLPASQLALSVYDAGFVQGVAVSEQMRTFAGRLFRLESHLARLERSLEIVGVDPGLAMTELADIAHQLAAQNHQQLEPGDDLGLSLFITPGPYPTFAPPGPSTPTVCLHTYPLPFSLWVDKYHSGQSLVVTRFSQVPPGCWPPELKCRSRMHYYLADRAAAQQEADARALLLDHEQKVVEASTANIVVYQANENILSPPREAILPGVSVAVLHELADTVGVPFQHGELLVPDVLAADEVLLTSTSPCILPVVRVNGKPIGGGRPGALYQRLLSAFSELVGLDIREQAERFARR